MKKRSIKDFQALYASVDEEWLVLIQWIFIKKEEQLSSKLVRPPIGSKTGSTYRYLWPVIRERVAFAPAQRPPSLL